MTTKADQRGPLKHLLTAVYFFFGRACDKALPAAVLLAAPVRLSRRTLDAADAAFLLVCFLLTFAISCASFRCDN